MRHDWPVIMATTLLPPVSTAFVVIAKKAYVPLANENDEIAISNWGALRLALQALLAEDSMDLERAGQLWAESKRLLVVEEDNLVGASAQGSVAMSDDFEMSAFPVGL